MTEFILMSGISGSGKSTAARNLQRDRPGSAVVCRDDIRKTVFGFDFGEHVDENVVTAIEFSSIRAALDAGHDVISDNTNLHPSGAIERYNIALACGADIGLIQIESDLRTALINNAARGAAGGRFVPEHVISAQAHKFELHKYEVQAVYEQMSSHDLT